jgi:hypothetical protein
MRGAAMYGPGDVASKSASTSRCRSTKSLTATARWTSARRSRCSCGAERPLVRA